LLSVTLLACSPGAQAPASATLPPNLLLRWSVSGIFGGESFEIESSGQAHYRPIEGPRQDWPTPPPADGMLSRDDLARLERTLASRGFCSLRSERSVGHMDETRPSLSVRLGSLDCVVELWTAEWQDNANAKACVDAVLALRDRLQSRDGGLSP
jgi:hypothetical protein